MEQGVTTMSMEEALKRIEKVTVEVEVINVIRRLSSGWGVINVKGDNGKIEKVVGEFPETLGPGDIAILTGYWDRHPNFGLQFKFSKIEVQAPDVNTSEGVCRLLQRLPWIGPVKAAAAIEEHGHEQAWLLAQTDPVMLGVPLSKTDRVIAAAEKLLSSFEEQVYFLSLGLSQGQINKLIIEYGLGREGAMKVIKEEPYRAVEIDGFGFLTVDKIALAAGVNPGAEGRLSACVEYFLEDSGTNQGHVWFYRSELINGSKRYQFDGILKILKKTAMDAQVPINDMPAEEDVERVLFNLQGEGKIVIKDGRIYNAELMDAEKAIFLAAVCGKG
jgi:hypothetical protein